MNVQDIVTLSVLAGTLLTVVGLVWKITRDIQAQLTSSKEETMKVVSDARSEIRDLVESLKESVFRRLDEDREHAAQKRGEIHQRMDDVFVKKEMCAVLHGNLKETTSTMANDLRSLLDRSGVE